MFEELCRFDENGDRRCPRCGHVGASRLISVFAAHGLENGHHGVGKNWGGSGGGNGSNGNGSSGNADAKSETSSPAPGGGCGAGCACAN